MRVEEIKIIPVKLKIREYVITFEYETFKGHKRRTDKRRIKHISKDEAKTRFEIWAMNNRTIVNAQILAIEEIKEYEQEIIL